MEMNTRDHSFSATGGKFFKPGVVSSYGLSIITLITFIFAMIAVPISGANAPGGGILYPYSDTLKQFPRDYIWQYLAMFMICLYLANMIIMKSIIGNEKQIFMQLACVFAIIASVTLLINYFVQVSVVPVSLMKKEQDGIALITQYNPHGLFIALEELGYTMMAVSFGFLIPVYRKKKTNVIAIIYFIAVIAAIVSFIFINIKYGLNRQDRYETVIISIDWLALIINGLLIGNNVKKL